MPIEEVRWLADLTGSMRIACIHMPASESEAMHARRYDGGRGETIYSRHAFSDHYPDPSDQPGGDPLRRSGAASIPSFKQRAAPAEPRDSDSHPHARNGRQTRQARRSRRNLHHDYSVR